MTLFSETLKKLREQKGLKQQDIADVLGITQRAYSFYETGRSEPSLEIIRKIADFYNIPIDLLVGRYFTVKNLLSEIQRISKILHTRYDGDLLDVSLEVLQMVQNWAIDETIPCD
ncbi:MAG: helix-turn-helix domain-containing protein [Oscillospiraceae bacterium]|nr:helix-turn-helix domain-containing protein [Oscillospiraceae bacterium]